MPVLSTPARTLLAKQLESGDFIATVNAKTKDHLPDGVFEKDPEEIAKTARGHSDSLAQAARKLNFARVRFGHNIKPELHERLNAALHILQKQEGEEIDGAREKHKVEPRDAGDR